MPEFLFLLILKSTFKEVFQNGDHLKTCNMAIFFIVNKGLLIQNNYLCAAILSLGYANFYGFMRL